MTDNIADKIFEIENTEEILSFKTYDGAPIWMFAKYYYMYTVMGEKLLGMKSPTRMRRAGKKMLTTLLKMSFFNLKTRKINSELVFFSTNRKTIVDDKFFNRYIDQLIDIFPDKSFAIEQVTLDWDWPFPRHNDNVCFDSIGRVKAEIFARFQSNKDYAETLKFVKFVTERTEDIAGVSFETDEIESIARHISKIIAVMRLQAKWIDRRIGDNVKCFLMVGAGFPYSYFINSYLKKRGIKTVELQHGYVTSTNYMYNYADAIKCNELVDYGLPDYMFTYGQWWSNQINAPMKCINIGNPYREKMLNDEKTSLKQKKLITIMSNGENVEETVKLAEYIRDNCKDYSVRYRPHPGEMLALKQYLTNAGIELQIDTNLEVYDSLYESDVIIGEITTVLFEAVGIVDRIIVWMTDYTKMLFRDVPFETIEEINEISQVLQNEKRKLNPNDFWDMNWKNNYNNFINNLSGVETK